GRPKLLEIPMAELPFQWRISSGERHRVFRQVHEDESLPEGQADREQRMFGLIEPGGLLHVRRAQQSPIQTAGPGVIRTLNMLGELPLWPFAHARPAMTADIVEPMKSALFIADDDQTLSRNLRQQILACLFQLTLVPHTKPFRRKDALPFFR